MVARKLNEAIRTESIQSVKQKKQARNGVKRVEREEMYRVLLADDEGIMLECSKDYYENFEQSANWPVRRPGGSCGASME